jgi:hypothetical protein
MRTLVLALIGLIAAPGLASGRGAPRRPAPAPTPAATTAPRPAVMTAREPLWKALQAELDRSRTGLTIPGEPAPYHLALAITDRATWTLAYVLGARMGEFDHRERQLHTQVRVGTPQLDSTGYYAYFPKAFGRRLALEDDPLLVRRAAHLALDEAYKEALKELSQKKAHLASHPQDDKTDDWTLVKPVSADAIGPALALDRAAWAAPLRQASAVFRAFPTIQRSSATLVSVAAGEHLLTSEGLRTFRAASLAELTIAASAQAPDGMPLALMWRTPLVPGERLPRPEELSARARTLATTLAALVSAPRSRDNYSGPVLFEGKAATETLLTTVGVFLAGNARPVAVQQATLLEKMVGRLILPDWLSVVDDPTLARLGAEPLAGAYKIDHEGVPAQRVTLVQDGKLRSFLTSRRPAVDVKTSNGHGRTLYNPLEALALPSNLIFQARRTVSAKALRAQYLALLRKKGIDHGYIVREVQAYPAWFPYASGRAVTMPQPLVIYRVDLKGHETLVRGVRFENLPLAELERIVAMGGPSEVVNLWIRPGTGVSVVSPSFIFDRVEITPVEATRTRVPILPSPLAAPAR